MRCILPCEGITLNNLQGCWWRWLLWDQPPIFSLLFSKTMLFLLVRLVWGIRGKWWCGHRMLPWWSCGSFFICSCFYFDLCLKIIFTNLSVKAEKNLDQYLHLSCKWNSIEIVCGIFVNSSRFISGTCLWIKHLISLPGFLFLLQKLKNLPDMCRSKTITIYQSSFFEQQCMLGNKYHGSMLIDVRIWHQMGQLKI